MPQIQREYKDRLFTFIFGRAENKGWILSLYNTINRSHYTDPEAIQITTLKDVIYLGMHNDVSFMIADEMHIYEQQSSLNPNMPIRCFLYAAKLFEQYLAPVRHKLYWKTLLNLPAPKCVVFYNGVAEQPDDTILKLSDAFTNDVKGDIEVCVRIININAGRNQAILNACQPLHEYAWTIARIREHCQCMSIEDAVDQTIAEMPESFLLKPQLFNHKAEVKGMILTEYHEEEVLKSIKEEGKIEGKTEGKIEGIIETLKGLVADNILSVTEAAKRANLSEDVFLGNGMAQKTAEQDA